MSENNLKKQLLFSCVENKELIDAMVDDCFSVNDLECLFKADCLK